ncbi:hypothetical protein JKP88DRAFT_347756 [Tribonema minus]|uniref:K Homology domain-containing protein n=1 Tax=Tribonema minus TaxID=303371 RepID=A0A835Z8V5_9STRA|nr:hypothetical protein JKP88DRAFT_347756 [Tribonema minus]
MHQAQQQQVGGGEAPEAVMAQPQQQAEGLQAFWNPSARLSPSTSADDASGGGHRLPPHHLQQQQQQQQQQRHHHQPHQQQQQQWVGYASEQQAQQHQAQQHHQLQHNLYLQYHQPQQMPPPPMGPPLQQQQPQQQPGGPLLRPHQQKQEQQHRGWPAKIGGMISHRGGNGKGRMASASPGTVFSRFGNRKVDNGGGGGAGYEHRAITASVSADSLHAGMAGLSLGGGSGLAAGYAPPPIYAQHSFPGTFGAPLAPPPQPQPPSTAHLGSAAPSTTTSSSIIGVGGIPLTFSAEAMSRVLIPNAKIGAVIGKGGAIVKHIRECSGARVTISDAGDDAGWAGGGGPGGGERLLHIIGSFFAVVTAFGAILAHAETPSNGDPLPGLAALVASGMLSGEATSAAALEAALPLPPSGFRMLISSAKAGALIGRAGATIKAIRDASGARIDISSHLAGGLPVPPGGAPPGGGGGGGAPPTPAAIAIALSMDRVVAVSGPFTACVRAHHLIVASRMEPTVLQMMEPNMLQVHPPIPLSLSMPAMSGSNVTSSPTTSGNTTPGYLMSRVGTGSFDGFGNPHVIAHSSSSFEYMDGGGGAAPLPAGAYYALPPGGSQQVEELSNLRGGAPKAEAKAPGGGLYMGGGSSSGGGGAAAAQGKGEAAGAAGGGGGGDGDGDGGGASMRLTVEGGSTLAAAAAAAAVLSHTQARQQRSGITTVCTAQYGCSAAAAAGGGEAGDSRGKVPSGELSDQELERNIADIMHLSGALLEAVDAHGGGSGSNAQLMDPAAPADEQPQDRGQEKGSGGSGGGGSRGGAPLQLSITGTAESVQLAEYLVQTRLARSAAAAAQQQQQPALSPALH